MDISLVVFAIAALVAAGTAIGTLALLTHVATKSRLSAFILLYPLVLFYTGVFTLTSSRDFTSMWVVATELKISPIATWATRLTSFVLLMGALIELIRFCFGRGNERNYVLSLIVALGLFVLSTSTATSLFGANPYFHYTLLYTPLFCIGAVCMRDADAVSALCRARDASLAFLAAGWLLLPVASKILLNYSYEQGVIPGLPRLAGLATHEVSLATMTTIFMALLLAFPYRIRQLNLFAWVVALATLLMAQSKNAWITSIVIYATFLFFDKRVQLRESIDGRSRSAFAMLVLSAVVAISFLAMAALLILDLPERLERFLHTSAGLNLLTFTGRDIIWNEAMNAWRANPWFGYGIPLFGAEHRAQIGILYATSGHNQIYDVLGRSGSVGLLGFVVLFAEMWRRAIRNATPTGGLSLVLIVSLTVRGVTEVPIANGLFGYEILPYILLLIVISRRPTLDIAEYRQSVLRARRTSQFTPLMAAP